MSKVLKKREALLTALARIETGEPIRIGKDRAISPTSVEDEAGVGRSTLRNTPQYKDIFDKVVAAKYAQKERKASKSGGGRTKVRSTDSDSAEFRAKLNRAKERIRELEMLNKNLMQTNTELSLLLLSERQEMLLDRWASAMNVDDVVVPIGNR